MEKYIKKARQMGAKNVVPFSIDQIVWDSRVILKCIFGCASFGRNHTCPYQKSPLSMDEYRKIFLNYKGGIIIGCSDQHISQKISFEIERDCFLDGYHFAFSLSDCSLCKECSKTIDQPCRLPIQARPAFHSIGIDVFTTVKQLGLPLYVAQTREDELNWYSAVFIE